MAAEKDLIKAVEQMKDGNREGFDTLYSYTYNYVYSRARYYMNNNEEDALDLTQETYMQVYKGIQNLQDAGNIYAWLGAIVYRQSMKMHNKNKDILLNEEAEGIFEDIECTSKDFKPEETAEENAVVDVIKGMLQELPEQQRQAVLAFYYDRMKIDEIAELFNCSPNTIKSRLNYAKQYLKEKVLAHEKKYAYRLHSVTPAVVYLAFKSLFTEKDYVLAAEKAQSLYDGICRVLGIAPTVTTIHATASSVTTGTTVNTTVKAGLSLTAKIAIGVATVLTTGAVTVGGLIATGNLPIGDANISTENQHSENEIADKQEKKVKKYPIQLKSYNHLTGEYTVSQELSYEFNEDGTMAKMVLPLNGETRTIEYKYEQTENGYVQKGYLEGQVLYTVSYYDENDVCYHAERYGANGLEIEEDRDQEGKLTKYILYNADGTSEKNHQEISYDEYGNITRQYICSYPNTEGSEMLYVYEYDDTGRPLKRTDQRGTVTLYEYDDENNFVKQMNEEGVVLVEEQYDENGNLIYKTQMGYVYTYKYDEYGYRLEYKMEINGVLTGHEITTYATQEEIEAAKAGS